MPDIGSYRILKDSRTTLVPGRNVFRTEFTLPDDTNYRARSVLAFVADPSANASLTLEIEVNGSIVKSSAFGPGAPRGLWEVLGANAFEDGDNEVRFTVPAFTTIREDGKNVQAIAGGKLGISDIVLWFTRTIPFGESPRIVTPRKRARSGNR